VPAEGEKALMPLQPGKNNIGANIRELTNHGSRPRSHKQIVAIALHAAEDKPKKNKPMHRQIAEQMGKGY
jgi:hypothetical protein